MIRPQPKRVSRTARRFRHGCVPVIGLIGDIGAGKSEVARVFRERGAVVIDADAVGHGLLSEPQVRDQILERFGPKILSPGVHSKEPAAIDRRALGTIVFGDSNARRDLEAVLHPRMRAAFESTINRQAHRDFADDACIVLDAAILLEAGWDDLCDVIVYVAAPFDERLNRVARQRGWSHAALAAREQAQWPADIKISRADLVITNDAGTDALAAKVDGVFALLTTAGRATIGALSHE